MNKTQLSMLGAVGLGLSVFATGAMAEACGDVIMAEMNWASAELMANVDALILKEGYGCNVELVPGATTTTFASMNEKGQPDVASEFWINAVREPLEAAYSEGRLHKLVDGPIEGTGEGWWVTEAFVKAHPELDTVEKVIEHPEFFPDQEDPSKGAFMGCPAGWGCQVINDNLFRAYGMADKGWKLVDPGSASGLDGAIAKAAERDEAWFGYYWAPTSIVGKYHLQLLPFEASWGGDANWHDCLSVPADQCTDPKPTSWIKSEVHTVVADKFFNQGGPAIDYLKARVFPADAMGAMLVYMQDEQAGGEDAAYYFLQNYADVWTKWVSPEAAEAIKAAL